MRNTRTHIRMHARTHVHREPHKRKNNQDDGNADLGRDSTATRVVGAWQRIECLTLKASPLNSSGV